MVSPKGNLQIAENLGRCRIAEHFSFLEKRKSSNYSSQLLMRIERRKSNKLAVNKSDSRTKGWFNYKST